MRGCTQRGNVGDVELRIARALDPDQLGSGQVRTQVCCGDQANLDTDLGEDPTGQPTSGVVAVVCHDQNIARAKRRQQHGRNRCDA